MTRARGAETDGRRDRGGDEGGRGGDEGGRRASRVVMVHHVSYFRSRRRLTRTNANATGRGLSPSVGNIEDSLVGRPRTSSSAPSLEFGNNVGNGSRSILAAIRESDPMEIRLFVSSFFFPEKRNKIWRDRRSGLRSHPGRGVRFFLFFSRGVLERCPFSCYRGRTDRGRT